MGSGPAIQHQKMRKCVIARPDAITACATSIANWACAAPSPPPARPAPAPGSTPRGCITCSPSRCSYSSNNQRQARPRSTRRRREPVPGTACRASGTGARVPLPHASSTRLAFCRTPRSGPTPPATPPSAPAGADAAHCQPAAGLCFKGWLVDSPEA